MSLPPAILCRHPLALLRERQRHELTRSRPMGVHGVWQRDGQVCNLIAGRLENLNPLLGRLAPESRDFH